MKTINKFINEKLKLNKDSQLSPDTFANIDFDNVFEVLIWYMSVEWKYQNKEIQGIKLVQDFFDNQINNFLDYYQLHDEITNKYNKHFHKDINQWKLEKFIKTYNEALFKELDDFVL